MLETRSTETHNSLCPAAYAVAETSSGSGVLCRVTGRLVTTGQNPGSLAAFCWCPMSRASGPGRDGTKVEIGYQACPSWRHNRETELGLEHDLPQNAPERVKRSLSPGFITRA